MDGLTVNWLLVATFVLGMACGGILMFLAAAIYAASEAERYDKRFR